MKKLIISLLLTAFFAASIFATPVYVCVGSFVKIENAMALADKIKNETQDVCISEFIRDDGTLFYRVLLNTNSDDLDKARKAADSAILDGAFAFVPKPEEKITVIHKAKNPAVAEPSKTPVTATVSPITLKSGATKIISSIADFGALIAEASEISPEQTTELDQLEDLIDYFMDLPDSEKFTESKSGRLVSSTTKNFLNKIDFFVEELDNNQKASITIDENINSDFSDLIPGLKVNTIYAKGNAEITALKNKYDDISGIKGKADADVKIDYNMNLNQLPFKTFIKELKGTFSAKAAASGAISESFTEVPAEALVSIRQEVAICNAKKRGGVFLLEGNIHFKGTFTNEHMEFLQNEDIKSISRALDDLSDLNLSLKVYDDNGKLYYMSSINSFETIAVFLEELDHWI